MERPVVSEFKDKTANYLQSQCSNLPLIHSEQRLNMGFTVKCFVKTADVCRVHLNETSGL